MSATDRGQRGEAAGVGAQVLAVLMRLCQEYRQIEKHELSKIDFEIIGNAFLALLQFGPDPVTNIVH